MPLPIAVAPDAELHTLEYVVVDVETTGRAFVGMDRVTEVAAVAVNARGSIDAFGSLVNPGRRIPPAITRLTGITNAMVARAPEFADIAAPLSRILTGRVFVAHNAAFDWSFLTAEFERTDGRTLAGDRVCTVRLARRLLTHLPRRNLDAVADYYGVTIEDRHRAMGDARVTAAVFTRMLDELGRQGIHTWGELHRMLHRRRSRRTRTAMPHPVIDFRVA